ncbi:MAG: hypothetical protein M1819_001852 [Sarea resinae]|nr:MAG: hypothetical protein M1819_001852 [Sarea resinae]
MVQARLLSAATAAAAALFLALPVSSAGLYTKASPVLQVDAKSYDSLIARSNYTSIVEFYAPWCGHCQNLKPAYEKAAKNLNGLAKVAAVNCDDDSNKAFCGGMGVKGFPTLKIVRPSKKPGRPTVEDYQGSRSAKGIVDAVVDRMPNHVKKVTDKGLEEWLTESNGTAKAILFTDKGTTSALIKALAIDFLGGISFAQIRSKEKASVELFGITSFPTLILLPGGTEEILVYDGELKKEALVSFFSQMSPPNPDPAPKKPKSTRKSKDNDEDFHQSKSDEDSSSFSAASASHASAEASEAKASATSIVLEDNSNPTESPDPIATPDGAPAPAPVVDAPKPIPTLETPEQLKKACIGSKTTTCVLAFLPSKPSPETELPERATLALASLAEISDKYRHMKTPLFPFYGLPAENAAAAELREILGLKGDGEVELVAVNARRTWWRRYSSEDFKQEDVESWIDEIRFGDGKKERLPDGVVDGEAEEHDEL